jgi:hypothetical protein
MRGVRRQFSNDCGEESPNDEMVKLDLCAVVTFQISTIIVPPSL